MGNKIILIILSAISNFTLSNNNLIKAARSGKINIIKNIINQDKINIDFQDKNGQTALIAAAKQQHWDIVELLLAAGANPFISKEHIEYIPKDILLKYYGHKEIIEIFKPGLFQRILTAFTQEKRDYSLVPVLKSLSSINKQDGYMQVTPLHIAALVQDKEAVNYILNNNYPVNLKDKLGRTAYNLSKDPKIKALIYNNSPEGKKAYKLINAVEKGDISHVKYLISQENISVNIQDGYGYTPLMEAVKNGDIEMVKFLINNGARINIYNIFGENSFEIANILLHNFRDFGVQARYITKNSLLGGNQEKIYVEIAKLLIDVGSDIPPASELTPEISQYAYGHPKLCEQLYHYGVAKRIEALQRDLLGPTYDQLFNSYSSISKIEQLIILLKALDKIVINKPDGHLKTTLLHLVAHENNIQAVDILLEKDAKARVKDKRNRKPIDLATDTHIIKILKLAADKEAGLELGQKAKDIKFFRDIIFK